MNRWRWSWNLESSYTAFPIIAQGQFLTFFFVQAATSPPLYLGTSILATRNAVLAMTLTSPAAPNLSADGTFRHPSHMEGDEPSSIERMRKLLRAGERSSTFQPNWSILRLKERLEDAARRERERDREKTPTGGHVNPMVSNGLVEVGEGEREVEKPKKSKKKRPVPEDEGEKDKEKKIKKKKVEEGNGQQIKKNKEGDKARKDKKKKKDEAQT